MYDHKTIEKKWQKKWKETKIYKTSEPQEKPKKNNLKSVWKAKDKMRAEGNKKRAEGDKKWMEGFKMCGEGYKMLTEGRKMWAEGNKKQKEGYKMWAEGDKKREKGDEMWAEAIIKVYGDIKLEWKNYDSEKDDCECHLETGEVFKP